LALWLVGAWLVLVQRLQVEEAAAVELLSVPAAAVVPVVGLAGLAVLSVFGDFVRY
jgi:hypothetical protein